MRMRPCRHYVNGAATLAHVYYDCIRRERWRRIIIIHNSATLMRMPYYTALLAGCRRGRLSRQPLRVIMANRSRRHCRQRRKTSIRHAIYETDAMPNGRQTCLPSITMIGGAISMLAVMDITETHWYRHHYCLVARCH